MQRLLIGTSNRGKVTELRDALGDLPLELVDLTGLSNVREVDETGTTFAENARFKAVGYARQTGMMALADDSGLEVAALDGRPGVLSARYGGDDLDFAARMRLVLDELAANLDATRRARFVCAMAIASPQGDIIAEGVGFCDGRIAEVVQGSGGFGYDPIFIPDGLAVTFGNASGLEKRQISHRTRAISQIIPFLRHFIEN